jgi:hypothetical protein
MAGTVRHHLMFTSAKAKSRPRGDRVIDFTNNGVFVGPDPLKARLPPLIRTLGQDPRYSR